MRDLFFGMLLIALGILLLLDNLDVISFGDAIRHYWPALLILWGISELLKKKEREPVTGFSDRVRAIEGELFHESNVFGDLDMSVKSPNFKGGSITAVFGDCEIDLTGATIAEGEHWLKISTVFGDTRVIVPPGLAISVSANTVLGDIKIHDEKRSGIAPGLNYSSSGFDTAPRRLHVTISQIMGSIRIQ